MQTFKGFEDVLYDLNANTFDAIALDLFHFQAKNNPVYGDYLRFLDINPPDVKEVNAIPFLPISFFKTHAIATGEWGAEQIFTSSGTTGQSVSSHAVKSLPFYWSHSRKIFEDFFGPLSRYHILALLPSYLERTGSSLISMVDYFIKQSGSKHSGFFLYNQEELIQKLEFLRGDSRKVLLLGVTFALLDLAEKFEIDLSHCMVMETGGMKGKRQELTRDELHTYLKKRFNVSAIFSEYGMTELLSQAYSRGDGFFETPSSMKMFVKELNDPFSLVKPGQTGRINVVDMGNLYSCAFIETQDLGRIDLRGYFEVLGRMDNSDVRGCNLLVG